MDIIKVIKYAALLRPILSTLIDEAEALVPEGGKGQQKLEAVKAGLASLWSGIDTITESFQSAWPAIQQVIAIFVGMRNALGVFKTGPGPKAG